MNISQMVNLTAGFFILIFATGIWVKRRGRPYPTLVLNIHKLIALGAVVYLVIGITKIQKTDPLTTFQIAAWVVSGIIFVATIVSGGLASIDKPLAEISLKIHRFGQYLTLLMTGVSLYFLS